MSVSDPFIRRPVATSLVMVGLLLIGAVAYAFLPVAPLPQVDFPTISVEATLPGASAETMASSVAAPLERAFSNISGIDSMTSSSSLGIASVRLQFALSKNIDTAAQDVQTAINAASGSLPKNLPSPPTYEKNNPADFTILSLALTSDTVPLPDLDRYADEYLAQQISQLPGIGLVDFHGEQKPAIRVRVNPDALAQLGLTLEDVRSVLGVATADSPKGSLDGPTSGVVLGATDQLTEASAYGGVIVAYKNGAPIRIRDIGMVVEAAEDAHEAAWLQGKRTIIIDIHKQPGFNVVQTIQGVKDRLPALMAPLPPSVQVQVVGDRTQTIRASVHEVQGTLLLTVVLVVLVIFAFLRSARATAIPSITIPLSFAGTFMVMWLLGYSMDNLSLMALTIAVGFVVDDAIVVIENTMRHIEAGERPIPAAIAGAREVGFTVVSMTSSLICVFIPVLLMQGIVGRLFREFAITLSVAVIMSGIVALTVTPMLCARILRSQERAGGAGPVSLLFERGFSAAHGLYARGLGWSLRHRALVLVATIALAIATVSLYVWVPKGFFPQQDTGLISGVAEAAPDSSFAAMSEHIQALSRVVMADPAVDNVYCWIGPNPTLSQGRMMINLKPFAQRDVTATQVAARLKPKLAAVEGAALFMQVRQDVSVGARPSKTQFQYTLQDADTDELTTWAPILLEWLKHVPAIQDVTADLESEAARATLRIDRDTASRFGITPQAIDDVLYDAFGQRQVATVFTQSNQYRVVLEVDPRFQLDTEALKRLYVHSPTTGRLVPLSLLGTIEPSLAPITINHQGAFPAVTISFNLASGKSLGDAVTAVEAAARELRVPDSLHATFQGTAQVFQSTLRSQPWLILAAIIAVYIVLGILYESYIHPLTILSSLPSAGVGALIALWLTHLDLSIMALIGILLLIGIVKKNAIMMVDFALSAQRDGVSHDQAIRQAALLRFRPIMMTTMAALLGALPIAVASGSGADLRRPLGITIVGGLLVSQILTLYSTPVVYLYLARIADRLSRRGSDSLQGNERLESRSA